MAAKVGFGVADHDEFLDLLGEDGVNKLGPQENVCAGGQLQLLIGRII